MTSVAGYATHGVPSLPDGWPGQRMRPTATRGRRPIETACGSSLDAESRRNPKESGSHPGKRERSSPGGKPHGASERGPTVARCQSPAPEEWGRVSTDNRYERRGRDSNSEGIKTPGAPNGRTIRGNQPIFFASTSGRAIPERP